MSACVTEVPAPNKFLQSDKNMLSYPLRMQRSRQHVLAAEERR